MPRPSRRDHLVDTALKLFNQNGYNATGIDLILKESGVAKMTLYNHFRSKEDLILAALQRRNDQFCDWIMDFVETRATAPRDRLLTLFDAYHEWFSENDYRGCMFLNAAAEFSGNSDAILRASRETKQLLRSYIRGLALALNVENPDRLADTMMLLLEGAISCSHVSGNADWSTKAKSAADILIGSEVNLAA
jgi:AcrR family transcriptional regulator